MGKPSPPTPPNPIATAAAQTGTNVSTAVANAYLGNVNQNTPQGSLSYSPTGSYQFTDPTLGQTYNIPTFTATQTLAPTQQATLNASEQAKLNLANLGSSQSALLQQILGAPVNTAGAPQAPTLDWIDSLPYATDFGIANSGSQAYNLNQFGQAGPITTSYGSGPTSAADPAGFEADRQAAQDALMGRLDPQLQIEKTNTEQRLADQGIRYGSPAYNAAFDVYNRQANDARLAVIGQATQQQQAMADMAAQKAGFQNAAQQQQFNQAQAAGAFYNTAQQNQFGQNLQGANYTQQAVLADQQRQQNLIQDENTLRQQYLQELYQQRNQPINETTALLSGSQVQNPQFVNTPQNQIPTTDIAGLFNTNFNQQQQNYAQQTSSYNALAGGILGGIGSIIKSDRDTKENISKMATVFAADEDGTQKKLPIYQYSYKDDPASTMHIGPMAQDVEKITPKAVKTIDGVKHIDAGAVMGSILKAA
jgi:hypothetical protein